jgi:membrane-associated phospholipid phosphatase
MPSATIDEAREQITTEHPEPFVAWPGWSHLLYAWVLSLANGIWFMLVFGGCDFITAHRALRIPIHFAAELKIPFIPAMSAVYMSIYLLFLAGPFILRTRREFRAVIATLATMIGIAGVGFLLIPGQLAFSPPREQDLGIWAGTFHLADRLNLDYDLVPSLHVALSVACITAFCTHTGVVGRTVLWIWATAIALSTLLTHQHHVIDVAAGWLLATLCMRFVYFPLICPAGEVNCRSNCRR